MFGKDIVLQTDMALLRPLAIEDVDGLSRIAGDPSLWTYFPYVLTQHEEMRLWVQSALHERQQQLRYPFAIVDKATGQIMGTTSFFNFSPKDFRVEIGWTWLGNEAHGTGINKHCKFLLFGYAFETFGYERVELKADVLNVRSRKAMLKVGATEEGILRSHMTMPGNRRRDTIYYSVLKSEWPGIKTTVFGGLATV